jgi:hypothetical protein
MMLIHGFNLSDWNGKELPNTEWLKFRDCIGITALGDLPDVHTLTIYNCPTLRTTGKMPLLRKWIVRVADNLQVVIPSNSLQLLAFEQLRTTVDVSKFVSVPKLSFYFNQQLHSIFGLGCQNSEVKLIGCRSVLDFTPLKNIYKVHIGETPMLVRGRDICNITHLTIDDCPNFVDTTSLGKVKSLKIYNCSKLRSLSELQTISRVVILNCDKVEDYSGVGQHDEALFTQTTALKTLYGEYLKEGRHEEIFQTIKSFKMVRYTRTPGWNGELFEFPTFNNNESSTFDFG